MTEVNIEISIYKALMGESEDSDDALSYLLVALSKFAYVDMSIRAVEKTDAEKDAENSTGTSVSEEILRRIPKPVVEED